MYYINYIILYHIVLYYIILYYIILYCIILYYIISYCIILYYIKLYYVILYYIILHYIILYYIILYYIILYYITLYYIILYYIILYYITLYYIILYYQYQDAGFDCNDDGGDGADTMTKIRRCDDGCTASSGTSQGTWYNCCRPMNGVSVKPVAFGILGVEGWCRGTDDPTCRKRMEKEIGLGWGCSHRIGWWENLQESLIFDGKNHGFL